MVNTHVPVSYSHRTTQYAQQRLVRDLCDLTDAFFSLKTTWNRLWSINRPLASKSWKHPYACTLHFLIGTTHTGPSAQIWHPDFFSASIWAEHNPNFTNPWCCAHTPSRLNKSFLYLSCKNSQENMSASPCSSNVMFFHLLMILCACTNLNVMIEILLKTLSFSGHLKQNGPRASSFNVMDHL